MISRVQTIAGRPSTLVSVGSEDAETGPEIRSATLSDAVTLRKLRIFWAVAHCESMTRAAKLLNVTQPSLSQQLAGFEAAIGNKLFDRRSNAMVLTEAGQQLLRKAEIVLRSVQELEDVIPGIGSGVHGTIRLGGVTSVMRALLPIAMRDFRSAHAHLEYDLHEGGPGEIMELLHARRITLGLLDTNSLANLSGSFHRQQILSDPYVLAVPEAVDLRRISAESDLEQAQLAVLNSTIQFVFGNEHSRRVEDWFARILPDNRLAARARSFEMALELVRQGQGVCLVPALAAVEGNRTMSGVRLYETDLPLRNIVAIMPAQYERMQPYAAFLTALQKAATTAFLPQVEPMPPFVATRCARGA